MQLDGVELRATMGIGALPLQWPQDIGMSRAGPQIRFGKRWCDGFFISGQIHQCLAKTVNLARDDNTTLAQAAAHLIDELNPVSNQTTANPMNAP